MINPYQTAGAGSPVPNTMRLVLRVSQALGVAPVRFQKTQHGWHASVSRGMFVVHAIFMTVLNAVVLCGYIIDANTQPESSMRMHSLVLRIAWTVDIAISFLIASSATYGGQKRLKKTLKCLRQCQKMKYTLGVKTENGSEEQRKVFIFILGICIVFFLLVLDIIFYLIKINMDVNRIMIVPLLFSTHKISYAMATLLEMQFVFTAFEIHSVLRSLNKVLKKIGRTKNKQVPSSTLNYRQVLVILCYQGLATTSHLSKRVPEAIQQLAATYDEICTQILKLGEANNIVLAKLLGMFILRMVITSYNLMNSKDGENGWLWITDTVLLFWFLVHLLGLLVMVEPPHLTKIEMERTNFLICRLENKFTDPEVSTELLKFSLYVALNKVSYSPAGVCKLSRSLLYSILGLWTTYNVVILQFRSMKSPS